ncbi:MAG: hypothetical protein NTW80_10095, partial [Deltaproteobacteria bacterium]|nr:hypothetical protein [Deltaproteobacteria bacterium]
MARKKLAASFLALLLSVSLALPGCTREQTGQWHTEQYHFSKEGRLVMKIAPDGGKSEFKYNRDGLPVEIKYPGGWVKYGYDVDGRRTWMKDGTGVTEYYYDALNRPVGVAQRHGVDKLLLYDYDSRGNLAYMALGDIAQISQDAKYRDLIKELLGKNPETVTNWGEKEQAFGKLLENLKTESADSRKRWLEHEATYHHDLLRRLAAIDTPQGRITYTYDPEKGQVRRLLPNGITSTFAYAPDGSLKSLRHEGPAQRLLAQYEYDYNQAGKVIKVRETTPQETRSTGYVWDSRGYLQEVQLP